MLLLFGYVGPESIMPLASAVAAILGAAMCMKRTLVNLFCRMTGCFRNVSADSAAAREGGEQAP